MENVFMVRKVAGKNTRFDTLKTRAIGFCNVRVEWSRKLVALWPVPWVKIQRQKQLDETLTDRITKRPQRKMET
ncbi:MAG: hypothetical protein J7K09_00775 [Desulfuromusa sp.]|nr:hypothetical protein [Desulfuromusa sp.]